MVTLFRAAKWVWFDMPIVFEVLAFFLLRNNSIVESIIINYIVEIKIEVVAFAETRIREHLQL